MPEVRTLRPHQDERTGQVIPPGVVLRVSEPVAESLRLSGIGEIVTATNERRERATLPRPTRR